jgi:hypothetical protein
MLSRRPLIFIACACSHVLVAPKLAVKQDGGIDVFEMQIALAGAAANLSAGKQ